jgi:Fic family protein
MRQNNGGETSVTTVVSNAELIKIFQNQRKSGLRGQIYWKTQVEMAYNSNKIEGSVLSKEQTRAIFETASLAGYAKVSDIIETDNHFKAFNYLLDTLSEPLSIALIKKFHSIIKNGTAPADGIIGDWKLLQNEVGGIKTTHPKNVSKEMDRLVNTYNDYISRGNEIGVLQILAFHSGFETIHPFLDGNGRVGRLILFREALLHDIAPFIILDSEKQRYYDGLTLWLNGNTQTLSNLVFDMQNWYSEEVLYLVDENLLGKC